MSEEKPLHVRVAEALGCKLKTQAGKWFCGCEDYWPWPHGLESSSEIKRYDMDWSATGPLIEKYKLSIEGPWSGPNWRAYAGVQSKETRGEFGATPLLTVCNLIIALGTASSL